MDEYFRVAATNWVSPTVFRHLSGKPIYDYLWSRPVAPSSATQFLRTPAYPTQTSWMFPSRDFAIWTQPHGNHLKHDWMTGWMDGYSHDSTRQTLETWLHQCYAVTLQAHQVHQNSQSVLCSWRAECFKATQPYIDISWQLDQTHSQWNQITNGDLYLRVLWK